MQLQITDSYPIDVVKMKNISPVRNAGYHTKILNMAVVGYFFPKFLRSNNMYLYDYLKVEYIVPNLDQHRTIRNQLEMRTFRFGNTSCELSLRFRIDESIYDQSEGLPDVYLNKTRFDRP